jgi:hypothetical protein
MKDNNTVRSGINFFELLGIVFIILRLCGVIDWPWVWVLAPIWMPIGLYGLVFLIVVIWAKLKDRKERQVKWNG